MADKTITGLTAVSGANMDDTALVVVDDKLSQTRKATLAQLWTALAAVARAFAGVVTFSNVTDATNTTSGGVVITGGLGVAKKLFVGDHVDVATGKVYKVATTVVASLGVTTVTDTYSILATDFTVVCNKASAFTVTLPTAVVGQSFRIKNIGVGTVTVDGAGADTLDGDPGMDLFQYESITVHCIAANTWSVL